MRREGSRKAWGAICGGALLIAALVTSWNLRASGDDAWPVSTGGITGNPGCGPKPTCAPSELAGCTPPCQLCKAAGTFYRDCGTCIEVIFCGIDAVCEDDGSCRVVTFTPTPPTTPTPTLVPCDGDLDGDRQVTIAEIVRAVSSALNGCDTETP